MSEEFVETLEDVVAYKITLSDLIRLFQTNIELANWGRSVFRFIINRKVFYGIQKQRNS